MNRTALLELTLPAEILRPEAVGGITVKRDDCLHGSGTPVGLDCRPHSRLSNLHAPLLLSPVKVVEGILRRRNVALS